MASSLHPLLVEDTTNNDPFGISQVSSLYGPGIWLAWILASITSWHAIDHRPKAELNGAARVQLLYTNWAAIDLFLQINSDDPAFGPIAAAVTICYWGVLHSLVLALRNTKAGHVLWVLLLSLILPCSALVSVIRFAYNITGTPKAGFIDVVLPWEHNWRIVGALYLLLVIGAMVSLISAYKECATSTETNEALPAKLMESLFAGGTMVLVSISVVSIALYSAIFVMLHVFATIPSCTLLKPCTEQSTMEWKQASTFLYALVVCAYEVGSDMVWVSRKAFDYAREWYMNRKSS
jgi:hypothetical protein